MVIHAHRHTRTRGIAKSRPSRRRYSCEQLTCSVSIWCKNEKCFNCFRGVFFFFSIHLSLTLLCFFVAFTVAAWKSKLECVSPSLPVDTEGCSTELHCTQHKQTVQPFHRCKAAADLDVVVDDVVVDDDVVDDDDDVVVVDDDDVVVVVAVVAAAVVVVVVAVVAAVVVVVVVAVVDDDDAVAAAAAAVVVVVDTAVGSAGSGLVAANPGVDPGTDPGADPGVDPGVDLAADPGVDPGVDPAVDPGVDPGADPAADPGVDPGADPGGAARAAVAAVSPAHGRPVDVVLRAARLHPHPNHAQPCPNSRQQRHQSPQSPQPLHRASQQGQLHRHQPPGHDRHHAQPAGVRQPSGGRQQTRTRRRTRRTAAVLAGWRASPSKQQQQQQQQQEHATLQGEHQQQQSWRASLQLPTDGASSTGHRRDYAGRFPPCCDGSQSGHALDDDDDDDDDQTLLNQLANCCRPDCSHCSDCLCGVAPVQPEWGGPAHAPHDLHGQTIAHCRPYARRHHAPWPVCSTQTLVVAVFSAQQASHSFGVACVHPLSAAQLQKQHSFSCIPPIAWQQHLHLPPGKPAPTH